MPLNINDLENRIQQKIDRLTTSNNSIEFVIPGMTEVTNVKSSVANTASLPNIYFDNIANGTVVFVESLGVPVIASKCTWLGLDGRFLQRDVEFSVYSWGLGTYGRLGDGTAATKSSPVSVVGGFIDWCQVSTGCEHSVALRTNGTLWSWGAGALGSLGSGNNTNTSSPVSVVGGFTNWCQVSAGERHNHAIRTNGTLWSWGQNSLGQLGDGTTVNKSSPVSILGGFSDWCQVSAGASSSVAIRTNGTIWSWGNGSLGQLGDGTTVNKSSPVSVIGGFTDWCQVSAGQTLSVALRTNGTLWSWGTNGSGQLGDGTTTEKCSPVSVVGGFTDWCQVSAGTASTVAAVRTNGTLWSWGFGSNGILGSGNNTNTSSPVSVVGGFTDWCQVSVGTLHSAAVRTNGTLWAWGLGSNGVIGNNSVTGGASPVSVVGGFTDWCQVSAKRHNLAIRACLL